MNQTSSGISRGAWRVDAALLILGAVLCLGLTGWLGLDWRQPMSFAGDHLLTLGNARSYISGNGFRLNDSLGFPGVRDHMFHPTFYFSQKSIMWLAARVTDNPALVVSIFYGVGIVLLYGGCYWSLRQLSIGRGLAWIGSVAFVVTPYFAMRVAAHDMLSVYYSVPFGALLALRLWFMPIGSWTRRWFADPTSWLLVLIVGTSGLYYAFFTTLFVAFVGIVLALSEKSAAPAVRAGALCAGVVVVLLVSGPGLGLVDAVAGRVTLTERTAVQQYQYGLFTGDALRTLSQLPFAPAEWASRIPSIGGEGSWGEWPGVLLTIVILAAPLIALQAAMARSTNPPDQKRTLLVLCACCIVFGTLFATRGGLGFLFNEMVTPAIRAQNRIASFLTFFALVIVLVWAERASSARGTWFRVVVPLALLGGLLVSAVPSVGALRTKQQMFLTSESEQADRRSIEGMLAAVHQSGVSVVLQLPVVPWPEAPPIGSFSPYRFELPHILDERTSQVRWSYGMSKDQRAYRRLEFVVDTHQKEGIVAAAAEMGFDAILIEKAALNPKETTVWTTTIEADLSPRCRVFDDERRILYALTPECGAAEASVQ